MISYAKQKFLQFKIFGNILVECHRKLRIFTDDENLKDNKLFIVIAYTHNLIDISYHAIQTVN